MIPLTPEQIETMAKASQLGAQAFVNAHKPFGPAALFTGLETLLTAIFQSVQDQQGAEAAYTLFQQFCQNVERNLLTIKKEDFTHDTH